MTSLHLYWMDYAQLGKLISNNKPPNMSRLRIVLGQRTSAYQTGHSAGCVEL